MASNNAINLPRMGLSSSAVLFELSISVWTGAKLDKNTSAEVDTNKHTLTRAGNYTKQLFAGCSELSDITKYVANVRNWVKRNTLPWSFSGPVLLPTARMIDFDPELKQYQLKFNQMVNDFVVVYPTLINAASMNLGALFDPEDYPHVDVVRDKFGFYFQYSPLPESGDFRVDIGSEEVQYLRQQYEESLVLREQEVARANWTRLHTELSRLVNQLREDGRIHESTFSGLKELCVILDSFNITRDAELDAARKDILNVLNCTDTKELKKDDAVRVGVREELSDILSKFNF